MNDSYCEGQEIDAELTSNLSLDNVEWTICKNNTNCKIVPTGQLNSEQLLEDILEVYSSLGGDIECDAEYNIKVEFEYTCSQPYVLEDDFVYRCQEMDITYNDIGKCSNQQEVQITGTVINPAVIE